MPPQTPAATPTAQHEAQAAEQARGGQPAPSPMYGGNIPQQDEGSRHMAAPHLSHARVEGAEASPAPSTPTAQDLAGGVLKRGRTAVDLTKEAAPRTPVAAKVEVDPDEEAMTMRPEDVPDPNYVVDLDDADDA